MLLLSGSLTRDNNRKKELTLSEGVADGDAQDRSSRFPSF